MGDSFQEEFRDHRVVELASRKGIKHLQRDRLFP